ncbi:MAG: EAL domain-containing protein [Huintestinicola sp.]|uniref:EAL domain-containing protein n=1 Tax=Huintestinicola sp. TaxID=2981661 RepID=UPI003EFE50E0
MNTTDFVTEYEYAASVLLLVLMGLYAIRDKFRTRANFIFVAILVATLASSVLHIFTTSMLGSAEQYPLWLNYALNIAYLFTYENLAPLSLCYATEIARQDKKRSLDRLIALCAAVLNGLLLFTTPFTKLVIYFDENMTYRHGPLFLVLAGIALLILAYEFVLIVRFRKNLKPVQIVSVSAFITLTIIASVIQLLFPEQIIGNYMIALSLLTFYISLENPAEYVDRSIGCCNAEAFYITAESYIERHKSFAAAAFCPMGLNYFTEILGLRESGNICAIVANDLKKRLKKSELFYLGNWEFVIISETASASELTAVLQDFFRKPISMNGIEAPVTPYICTLTYPGFVSSAKDIRDAIDFTLKSMKGGKETVLEMTAGSLESKQRELKVLAAIKQAIKDDSFQMYYQPLYDIKTGTFSSAEALIRMIDKELGFVSPEEFIPLAEANGLIPEIGELSFRSVCRFLKSGKAQAYGIKYIEVNLSVLQCAQEKLSSQLMGIMEEYSIPPEQINFEITETAGLANYDALLNNMNRLISRGVSFSMDDYGTGFSTANYLITLPTDIVKIDKSILWPAMENKEAFIVLRHTVEMLRSLKKKIVAEGVETAEMVKLLSDIGCDYLQGYYYSKPIPPDAFITFLADNARNVQTV